MDKTVSTSALKCSNVASNTNGNSVAFESLKLSLIDKLNKTENEKQHFEFDNEIKRVHSTPLNENQIRTLRDIATRIVKLNFKNESASKLHFNLYNRFERHQKVTSVISEFSENLKVPCQRFFFEFTITKTSDGKYKCEEDVKEEVKVDCPITYPIYKQINENADSEAMDILSLCSIPNNKLGPWTTICIIKKIFDKCESNDIPTVAKMFKECFDDAVKVLLKSTTEVDSAPETENDKQIIAFIRDIYNDFFKPSGFDFGLHFLRVFRN